MRKIIAGLFISLDGVVENPHEWHFPYFNDEMGAAVSATTVMSKRLVGGVETPETSVATQLMSVVPIGNVLPECRPVGDTQVTVAAPPFEANAVGFV